MVFRMAYAQLDTFVHANDVEKRALSQILDSFDYDTFKAMQQHWLKRGRMIWYAYGNLSKDQSKQIVD